MNNDYINSHCQTSKGSEKVIVNGFENMFIGGSCLVGGAVVATAGVAGFILSNLPNLAPTLALGGIGVSAISHLVVVEQRDRLNYVVKGALVASMGIAGMVLSNVLPESGWKNLALLIGGASFSGFGVYSLGVGCIQTSVGGFFHVLNDLNGR